LVDDTTAADAANAASGGLGVHLLQQAGLPGVALAHG